MRIKKILLHNLLLFVGLPILLSSFAQAHNGPPFAIVVDQVTGPCKISIWTHPDIGTGTFFVLVDPLPGGKIPDDLKVDIGIQPESNRLPEVVYPMQRDNSRGELQYNATVDFDRQDFFRVRVHLQSSAGSGEAISRVEATPAGFGRWDLLFYALPFLFVAAMFYRGVRKRKKLSQDAAAAQQSASSEQHASG